MSNLRFQTATLAFVSAMIAASLFVGAVVSPATTIA